MPTEPTNTSSNATPTPEEIAFYEKNAAPSNVNPLRDLSADDLFSLATQDPDNFHIASEFSRNKDLWGDQNFVQKVADVNRRIKDRGFQLSDVPGPVKIARSAFDIAKGFGKQLWNYSSALIGTPIAGAVGEITGQGPGFQTALAQEGQRQVMENVAGTEQAVTGLARMGEKLVNKAAKSAAAYSGQEITTTPEQRVKDLFDDVGALETEQEISKGKGGFLEPVGGEVRKELEAAGKPVRPEEVQQLAAGDPLSFYTFGKIFHGAGKVVPPQVGRVVEKVAEKAGQATEAATGRAIQAAGAITELGGKAAQVFGPTAGAIVGTLKAGPFGTFAGEALGRRVQGAARKVAAAGEKLQTVGKEIAGVTPVTSGVTQLAKDVVGAVPMAAAEIGKGLTFDLGTAALTSESPQDTQSVGIGAFFGGANALRRAGGRIISGQIVGPRAWGSDTYVPSSGKVDAGFESMHTDALKTATPAVRTRLNAVREFLKGSNADTDVFLAKDSPSLAQALTKAGMDAQSAKTASEQEGFFQATIPGKDGTPRRVIFARNVDAAPHEAFHAIQDVLGEDANQMIDQIVRQEYGPQWEAEGQRYAQRIDPSTLDWRETILDSTGTGLDYAKEKIAMDVANEYRAATGAEPPSKYVQDRAKEIFGQTMDRALQANPDVEPNQIASRVWRDILSPQEATSVADTYLARELAAENFDAVFKNLGASLKVQGLTGRLARVVANLASTLGIEPLSAERVSQIGKIAPKFAVAEAVRQASGLVQPRQESAVTPKPQVVPPGGKSVTPNEPVSPTAPAERTTELADEARAIAESAPETSPVAGTASPREILGAVAEAIAQQSGLKVNYLSAEGEGPAASISSNREARRAVIEAFRTMPAEARALWEKNFFPDRVVKLKGNKFQILGWAPEVFASNAHKLAAKLTELGVAEASPYPIENNTFTPEGWKQLFDDTKIFVQNQMGGRTGAGEPLVVPKGLPGMFAPPEKGQPVPLEQGRADFISMLFGIKLPETARVQKGKLPLNIAGQEVSAATKPGRVEVPVIPRGEFEGPEAQRQGIEGRQIMEVNPLRQQIEAAAQAKGVAMPEFIEAQQRLNLENIKNVEVAPELPQFRGNVLTLIAGFQPSAEPRAIKGAAVQEKKTKKIFTGFLHADAQEAAHMAGVPRGGDRFIDGFVTNEGEFLTRDQAFNRAEELNQLPKERDPDLFLETGGPGVLESIAFDTVRRFQPKAAEEQAKEVAAMTPEQFRDWSLGIPKTGKQGFTEVAHEVGLAAPSQEFVDTLIIARDAFGDKAKEAMKSGNFENAMILASQQQFFREAWEAATGEGSAGFFFREKQPGFQPKFPVDKEAKIGDTGAVKFQPKEYELKPAKQGFSKAWILPNGKPVQLGGQWHHDFLNENNALRKQYDIPKTEGDENRVAALSKGFARINYAQNTGRLTVEARTADWPKLKNSVRDFVEANSDKIDHIQVTLMDRPVEDVQHTADVKVFQLDDNEKAAMTPFMDLNESPKMTAASERLFNKATSGQFQPPTPEEEAVGKRMDQRLRAGAGPGRHMFEQARRYHPLNLELEKIREGDSGGQTFTKTGDVWNPGDRKADIVTLASINVPTKDLTPEKFREAIAPYKELLSDDVVAGVFKLSDGENSSIDINAVVSQEHRDNTMQFAKDNDQQAIWDAVKNDVVSTGGSGDTKLKTVEQIKAALPNLLAGKPVQFQPKSTPTDEEVTAALSSDKKAFVGAHRDLPEGTAIGVRIDIPAFERNGTYVQTVHEKAKGGQVGKRLGYDSIVTVDEPVFFSNEKGALKIKEGAPKFPIATVEGKYNPERTLPEDVESWTEVGFNPKRHSYFYEKSTEEPVLSGTKAVAVGNSVFVKDAVFGKRENFQFQPKAAEEALPGMEEPAKKKFLTKRELMEMTPEQLGEAYPEAVIPKSIKETIPSKITESPLFKRAIDEDAAVRVFGDKLAEFARENADDPLFKMGRKWYEEFTPQLKKEFGPDAELFAELLAATSPQTSVASNFGYAVDAIESFRRGRFTKIMSKFHQGLDMMASGEWKQWYQKELDAGRIPKPPKKPTPAAFMARWITKHNLKPTQTNGSLYGMHSLPVLQVFARQWLTKSRGPKTLNFVENLLGTSDEATIDLWADRTMRRIGYEGQERWRILPRNIMGVSDKDFAFSQKAFRHAATQLGMKPSSLQAALWFTEKGLWDKNGWSKLDLGDFREQMKRLPKLRENIEKRLTVEPRRGKMGQMKFQPKSKEVYIEREPNTKFFRVVSSSGGGVMQGGFYSEQSAKEYAKALGDRVVKVEPR